MSAELADELRTIGIEAGLCAIGFTAATPLEPARTLLPGRRDRGLAADMDFTYRNPDRSTDASVTLPPVRTLIAGAYDYRSTSVSASHRAGDTSRPSGATLASIARYAQQDHYADLRRGLQAMADHLRRAGFRAQVRADDNALVDRNVAWRAALGWYGKNANLLLPGIGSWVVLGQVLTDAELPAATAPVADGCGSCRRCIDECPTDAIVAPGVIDARRCLAWVVQGPGPIPVELRAAVGDRIYGCDDCQEACPPNHAAESDPSEDPPRSGSKVDLHWVLSAGDDELLERLGAWYIADRDPDNIRRTALVVLGNVADPDDAVALELVDQYRSAPSPLLSEHAAWAAERLRERAIG